MLTLPSVSQIVSQFAETDGPKLQELLVKHAQDKQNWLADWWLNCAYLDYRSVICVYVSVGQSVNQSNN